MQQREGRSIGHQVHRVLPGSGGGRTPVDARDHLLSDGVGGRTKCL